MAGKKERRSLKDKKRSRELKGQTPTEKLQKSTDQKSREKILWNQRKEQGQAGMAGAGRAGKIPSKKRYTRNQKHKGGYREASFSLTLKVARMWLLNNR